MDNIFPGNCYHCGNKAEKKGDLHPVKFLMDGDGEDFILCVSCAQGVVEQLERMGKSGLN